MTKADIVNEIAKNTGIDKATVLTTLEAFMDSVKDSLSKDENVYLRGFGSFIVKKRAQKIELSKKEKYEEKILQQEDELERLRIENLILKKVAARYPRYPIDENHK